MSHGDVRSVKKPIRWSGCWERRPDRAICRWILCWVHSESLLGAVGGYSGGGAFQLEKFSIRNEGEVSLEANVSLADALSCAETHLLEDCLDKALSFHHRLPWLQADTLYLKKSAAKMLRQKGDLLLGGRTIDFDCGPLFEAVGLITRPDCRPV